LRPGLQAKDGRKKRTLERVEERKASIRAKVEHPFRVTKRQFCLIKVAAFLRRS
jgi:transposase, IS5 family